MPIPTATASPTTSTISGGKISSGSALRARYLARRIVAVAPGLIGSELIVALCDSGVASAVCAGKGAGVATAGRSEPAEPLELAGEPPGTVTLRILLCLARTP